MDSLIIYFALGQIWLKSWTLQGFWAKTMTFSEYGERFEMMQLVEEDCLRTQVEELSHMAKVYYFMDNINKLGSVSGYVN
jgi:hypothetical protein